jgi:hypothetical protein
VLMTGTKCKSVRKSKTNLPSDDSFSVFVNVRD